MRTCQEAQAALSPHHGISYAPLVPFPAAELAVSFFGCLSSVSLAPVSLISTSMMQTDFWEMTNKTRPPAVCQFPATTKPGIREPNINTRGDVVHTRAGEDVHSTRPYSYIRNSFEMRDVMLQSKIIAFLTENKTNTVKYHCCDY